MTSQSILLIDDDEVDRKATCRALAQAGWQGEIVQAANAEQARLQVAAHSFSVILLDYNLPATDGLALLSELLATLTIQTPIVMLTGEGNEMVAVEAMKQGAYDYLPKSMLTADGVLRVITQAIEKQRLQQELTQALAQLQHQALYDSLTELGNRGLFKRDMVRVIAQAQRNNTSFCLLMIDLNHFKLTNDTYGHDTGDAVLSEAGRRLSAAGRAYDSFYRLGGDEFTAIIATPDAATVLPVAKRIVSSLMLPFQFNGHEIVIGASIGIAIYPHNGLTADALLQAADIAMYQAKRGGRDMVFARRIT